MLSLKILFFLKLNPYRFNTLLSFLKKIFPGRQAEECAANIKLGLYGFRQIITHPFLPSLEGTTRSQAVTACFPGWQEPFPDRVKTLKIKCEFPVITFISFI
jgi:hypothetical protein